MHDPSIQNYVPHWFISFICTRPFDQHIWVSFICSFFCARTFMRPRILVLINIFLFAQNHLTKIYDPFSFILSFSKDYSTKVLLIYFFYCAQLFCKKFGASLIPFVYLHTSVLTKYMALFHLVFLLHRTI